MSDVTLSLGIRSNLLALNTTQSLLQRSSDRIATGLKVSKPIDNASAFFAAQALKNVAGNQTTAQTNITQTSNTLETAISGLRSIAKLVQSLEGTLASLSNATTLAESDALRTQYNNLLGQIDNLATAATYQGVNLINTSTASVNVSFSGRPGVSDLSVSAIRSDSVGLGFSTIAAGLFFQLTTTINSTASRASIQSVASVAARAAVNAINSAPSLASTASVASTPTRDSTPSIASVQSNATNPSQPSQASQSSLNSFASVASRASVGEISASPAVAAVGTSPSIGSVQSVQSAASRAGAVVAGVNISLVSSLTTTVGNALSTLNASQQTLGSTNGVLAIRLEFSKEYTNTLESGAASLTVADLNVESANLASLQTAQSLGVVSLSITNQTQQSLLRLF
jgi:flagellin